MLFFWVLGRLQLHLSCTPWRVLGALIHELRNSRSPEAFVAKALADFSLAGTHHLQPAEFKLGWAGHSSGGRRELSRESGFGWSWLRFRIWENHIQARNRRSSCNKCVSIAEKKKGEIDTLLVLANPLAQNVSRPSRAVVKSWFRTCLLSSFAQNWCPPSDIM